MNNEQWTLLINAIAAISTIAIAVVALITIRQNVKERRNRRLEEIIEWATEIGKIEVKFTADTIHKLNDADGNLFISVCVDKALRTAIDYRLKAQHSLDIVESFDKSLRESTVAMMGEFELYIEALEKWARALLAVLKNPGSDDSELEGLAIEAGTKEYSLHQLAGKFIGEVNKARIKNIL